jgi:hypothetical protein
MTTPLERVRQKVIEAVPEVIELYEFCGAENDVRVHRWRECRQCVKEKRDITLADVLRTMYSLGVQHSVS